MDKVLPSLDSYPELEQWFLGIESIADYQNNFNIFLTWQVCKALKSTDKEAYYIWENAVSHFLNSCHEPIETYLNVEAFLFTKKFNLPVFSSDIGLIAVDLNQGEKYQTLMQIFADKTDISAYRFISAWLSLNTNQLQRCIDECEKITDPNHSVYTLSGQAQLELGNTNEALEDLELACKLNQNEILTWFQLGKLYLVIDDFDQAWNAAEHCLRLAPYSEEVKLFLSIIALKDPSKKLRTEVAWTELSPILEKYPSNESIVLNLMELAFKSNHKEWANFVIANSSWDSLKTSKNFMSQLSLILRSLGDKRWYDLSALLINSIQKEAIG